MMPLAGLLTAVMVGWFMKREMVKEALAMESEVAFNGFIFVLKYLTPAAVMVVFIYNLL